MSGRTAYTPGHALYTGTVVHHRRVPREHHFRYRLVMCAFDLGRMDHLPGFRPLISNRGPALVRFCRRDYHGDPARPLAECVRDTVEARCGQRPTGPILLLTQPRVLGYVFNPVSFYYCLDEEGGLQAVLAEITNTPWNERHTEVLARGAGHGREQGLVRCFPKSFHVSPFMPMDQDYEWSFGPPGQRLEVAMVTRRQGQVQFGARLELERRPFDGARLALAQLAFPLMPVRIVWAIHWQALRLWLKGVPFHPHPKHKRPDTARSAG